MRPTEYTCPYQLFNIDKTRSDYSDLKSAFRKLIFTWHPDYNHSDQAQIETIYIYESFKTLKAITPKHNPLKYDHQFYFTNKEIQSEKLNPWFTSLKTKLESKDKNVNISI